MLDLPNKLLQTGNVLSSTKNPRSPAYLRFRRRLISASREMEQQLLANKESMKQASLLFQNSGEGMMVTNAKDLILTVNPEFSVLGGYTEKELLRRHAYELASKRHEREFFDSSSESVAETGH